MTSPCSASHSILTLRDEDLDKLNGTMAHSSQGGKFVKRHIDIHLSCKFSVNGLENCNYKLEVLSWQNGITKLCGSCSFCNLLADSMQRSVESDLGPWNLSSKLDLTVPFRPFDIQVTIRFNKLEYQKDYPVKTFDKLNSRSISRFSDVYLVFLSGQVALNLQILDSQKENEKIEVDLVFELFGKEDDPIVKLLKIHRRPIDGQRLSDENVTKMRHWIRDCDESHDRCNPDSKRLKHLDGKAPTDKTVFLPTRMVEVGDTLNNKHPRLIITSEMQPKDPKDGAIKYMALSYCWGQINETSTLLTTTHETLPSRIERIEFKTMPRVFQDAITVARILGIQYLWIDSLCIIQDDAQDWQIQSSKMAQIFSNAYLTLAAAFGSSCNDSFLAGGLPSLSCTVPCKIGQEPSIEGQFSLRFRRRRGTSDKMADIVVSRWLQRGWTFQEERLARRVLMFGEIKFFFDCRTLEQRQDSDKHELRPEWVTSMTERSQADPINLPKIQIDQRWDHWQTLCTHYTYRELTFPRDKLPAISGMANKFAKKVQSKYLAGLWKNNLTHDLFWEIVGSVAKPKEYRAPSWSWASLDGRLGWPLWLNFLSCNKCHMYCTILEVQATPDGLDPYGTVKDGFLKIQGVVEEMKVSWVGRTKFKSLWKLYYEGVEIGNANLDMENDVTHGQGQEKIYQALLVAECRSGDESKTPIRGLLLNRNGHVREGCDEFERVGTFTLFSSIMPGLDETLDVWNKKKEQVILVV